MTTPTAHTDCARRLQVDLAGRVALVTGGGGVLGSAMARTLAGAGAAVVIANRRLETASAVADSITAAGGRALALSCDVLDRASLLAAQDRIEAAFGPVEILVNGAGGNHPKGTTTKEVLEAADLTAAGTLTTFFDLEAAGVDHVFRLNFQGTLLPCQVFMRGMAARQRGVVINISSMSAFTPLTKISAYSAAKAAVSNFTQWLAVHMAPVGVRVNAIAPGFFLTEQNRALLTRPDGGLTPRGDKILAHTPMRRFGAPEDLAGVLLWLASDASAFVTGIVVPVDGGFSAYSGV